MDENDEENENQEENKNREEQVVVVVQQDMVQMPSEVPAHVHDDIESQILLIQQDLVQMPSEVPAYVHDDIESQILPGLPTGGIDPLVLPSGGTGTADISVSQPTEGNMAQVSRPLQLVVDSVGNEFDTWTRCITRVLKTLREVLALVVCVIAIIGFIKWKLGHDKKQ
ncbi:hypothetical protein OROMI_009770 [Orobanche minor]